MSDVLVERKGPLLICTLNRPEDNNSITADVFRQLYLSWSEADNDPNCRAIITANAGANFCVGAEQKNFAAWTQKSLKSVFEEEYAGKQGLPDIDNVASELDRLGMNRWAWMVSQIQTPMIAAMSGIAAGGGLGLALLHHFRFGDDTCKLTTAFVRLGLSFELGLSHLLPELIGTQRALEISLSGRVVRAAEALEIGLVDRVTKPEDLLDAAEEFANHLAGQSPLALRTTMNALLGPRNERLKTAMEAEFTNQQILWESEEFRSRARKLMDPKRS